MKTDSPLWTRILEWVLGEYGTEFKYVAFIAISAAVRAAGRTVNSGFTGLKFSFGRATRECPPGFYPLIPFVQKVRVLPTRQRTLDLPSQRVTTLDGLVFEVDANLIFRVVDVRKALIEIDDLDEGMLQVLGLAVQDVLRARERGSVRVSDELDRALEAALSGWLEAWGVAVEGAGFTTITPTKKTLRVTQMAARANARRRARTTHAGTGIGRRTSTALLGTTSFPAPRMRLARDRAFERSRHRRLAAVIRRARERGLEIPEESTYALGSARSLAE